MRARFAIISLTLVIILVSSGCITTLPKDCGSDESCFAEAMRSCSPAKVKTAEKDETIAGLRTGYIISAEIKGKEGDACNVEEGVEKLEIRGNLTEAPALLLQILISLGDSTMTCRISGDVDLDLNGTKAVLPQCEGNMKDALNNIFEYIRLNSGTATVRGIKVMESYCVGGKKIVVYVRNVGTETLNITGLTLYNASNGAEVQVGWKDFSGHQNAVDIIPGEMAQFHLVSEPGTYYSYELAFDEKSYPINVQC